eukprot:g26812.t1
MAGWDECDRLLAEASSKASPPCTGEDLLFEEGEQVQVWPIKLGLGRLEEILSIRPGEICEVYGAPGTGKTLLGLSDPPWALAERLGSLAAARQIDEAALEHVRIYQAMNFTDFAQILAAPEIFQDKQPLARMAQSLDLCDWSFHVVPGVPKAVEFCALKPGKEQGHDLLLRLKEPWPAGD